MQPSVVYVEEGRSVTFDCKSETDTEWTFNGGDLNINVEKLSYSKITIINVVKSNDGRYECFGKTENLEDFISQVILKVIGELCKIDV